MEFTGPSCASPGGLSGGAAGVSHDDTESPNVHLTNEIQRKDAQRATSGRSRGGGLAEGGPAQGGSLPIPCSKKKFRGIEKEKNFFLETPG